MAAVDEPKDVCACSRLKSKDEGLRGLVEAIAETRANIVPAQ